MRFFGEEGSSLVQGGGGGGFGVLEEDGRLVRGGRALTRVRTCLRLVRRVFEVSPVGGGEDGSSSRLRACGGSRSASGETEVVRGGMVESGRSGDGSGRGDDPEVSMLHLRLYLDGNREFHAVSVESGKKFGEKRRSVADREEEAKGIDQHDDASRTRTRHERKR